MIFAIAKKDRFSSKASRVFSLSAASAIALTSCFNHPLETSWKTHSVFNFSSGGLQVASLQNNRNNLSLGEKNVSIGGGGYVTGIYLHPRQQDLVYIKTDVGGFYRWNPANQSWIPLTDHFPLEQSNYYGGESLAFDPNNPNIVYIAAGKYTADWSKELGTIFKSTDKGSTWKKLNIDLKMGGNEDLRWAGERLAVNPFNSNILLFGSRLDGLWKSSDAGETWSQVRSFPGKPEGKIGVSAIAFSKQQPGLVYAIAYGDSFYKSTDAGVNWSKMADSPAQANRVAIAPNGSLYVTHRAGVSQYENGSWSDITPFGKKANYNAIAINPANAKDLLVVPYVFSSTKIYRSLDGGTTWTEQKRSMNNTVPWWSNYMLSTPAVAAIEFDPKVAGRVWFTDWYGTWRTDNINAAPVAWTNYQKGHEEIVTFTLVSPPKGAVLLSGVADVDGFYHDRGLDAYPSKMLGFKDPEMVFQDTYSIAYSESDPLKMVRVGGRRSHSTYTGATSTDGGRTWQPFASWPSPTTQGLRVAMSATHPNRFIVVVANSQPLRTEDGGASWKPVSGLPNGMKGAWDWTQPLAADTVDGNTFYYYVPGKVYRSTDGGASFSLVNESLPRDYWYSLKTVPGVKGEVWVGLEGQGLYRSTDGGKTFSKLERVEKARLFAFGKPQAGSTTPALYIYGKIAGMGEGIFRSLDRGQTWTRMGDRAKPIGNVPNVMEASKQEFGLVFIGTNGRGIYYGSR